MKKLSLFCAILVMFGVAFLPALPAEEVASGNTSTVTVTEAATVDLPELATASTEIAVPETETPAAVAAVEAEEEVTEPVFWLKWLDVIIRAVGSGLGMAALWGVKKWFSAQKETEIYAQAIAALEEGWSVAQEDFVIWAKRAKEDGKLTKEERQEARDIALKHAKSVASGPARDLLVAWGQEKIQSILGQITTEKSSA